MSVCPGRNLLCSNIRTLSGDFKASLSKDESLGPWTTHVLLYQAHFHGPTRPVCVVTIFFSMFLTIKAIS